MRLIDADEIRIKPEYMYDICGVAMIRVEDIARILNDMPAIKPEPERKKGKWIPHKSIFGGLGEKVYTCDKCGYNIGFHVENFCPNCGSYNGGESE